MTEYRRIYEEPKDAEEAKERLKMIMINFANKNGDLAILLQTHKFSFEELAVLLETSLYEQADKLKHMTLKARHLQIQLDKMSQGTLF